MALRLGTAWGGFMGGKVVGAAHVTIGDRDWRCLKVATVAQHFRSPTGAPTVYAEWYISESGRTVLFRRYNGPDYRPPDSPTSYESLASGTEVMHEGTPFRHAYDCLPDISL